MKTLTKTAKIITKNNKSTTTTISKTLILGLDCGGTKTDATVFEITEITNKQTTSKLTKASDSLSTKQRTIIHSETVAFPSEKSTVVTLIKKMKKIYPGIKACGIGFPAPILKGMIYGANNLSSWKKTNIEHYLKEQTGLVIKAENDARCFAYGVHALPEFSKYTSLVGITLGTGIGCGVIINNSLVLGATGSAGEINKIPYEQSILENYTSKKFFLSRFKREPKAVFLDALHHHHKARIAVEEYAEHLGKTLALITLTYEPECVVFGGSISKSYWKFAKHMIKTASRYTYEQTQKKMKIAVCDTEHIATYGAALLAYNTIYTKIK